MNEQTTAKRGRTVNLMTGETATEVKRELPLLNARKKALERLLGCFSTLNTMASVGCRYQDVIGWINSCKTKVISTDGIIAYGEKSTAVIRIYSRIRKLGLMGYADYTLHLEGMIVTKETCTEESNIDEEARIYCELEEVKAKIRQKESKINDLAKRKEEEKVRRSKEQEQQRKEKEERARLREEEKVRRSKEQEQQRKEKEERAKRKEEEKVRRSKEREQQRKEKEERARLKEERKKQTIKRMEINEQIDALIAKKKEIWMQYQIEVAKINDEIKALKENK